MPGERHHSCEDTSTPGTPGWRLQPTLFLAQVCQSDFPGHGLGRDFPLNNVTSGLGSELLGFVPDTILVGPLVGTGNGTGN